MYPTIASQDFDDWDDVGLNVPKPPNLLYLFRNYSTCALSDREKIDRIQQLVSLAYHPSACDFSTGVYMYMYLCKFQNTLTNKQTNSTITQMLEC